MKSLSLFLISLLCTIICFAHAVINRQDGASNAFNIIKKGRMYAHTVVMVLEEITLEECTNYCIMHLDCHTVTYSSSLRLCELNDMDFDEVEADEEAEGWFNYGTPAKVDGGFSDWKNLTECSKTCGDGHMVLYRSCDNPKPQQGGADCRGDERKTEPCFIQDCPVCYGAKNNDYGEFVVQKPGQLKAIRLIHVSGALKCTEEHESRWGCMHYNNNRAFLTIVTDRNDQMLFPKSTGPYYYYYYYTLDDSTINDDNITISRVNSITVRKDEHLRIWDLHDLNDLTEDNNSGKHCVLVELIYNE